MLPIKRNDTGDAGVIHSTKALMKNKYVGGYVAVCGASVLQDEK